MSLTVTQLAQNALNTAGAVYTRSTLGRPVSAEDIHGLSAALMALAEAVVGIGNGNAVATTFTASTEYSGTVASTAPISTRH